MKKVKQAKSELVREVGYALLGMLIGGGILAGWLWSSERDRVLPGVKVLGVEVGGWQQAEVEELIKKRASEYSPTLWYGEAEMKIPKEMIQYNYEETAKAAVELGKNNWAEWGQLIAEGKEIGVRVKLEEEMYAQYLQELRLIVNIPGVPAQLELSGREILIEEGEDGVEMEEDRLRQELLASAMTMKVEPVELRVKELQQALSEEEVQELDKKASELVNDKIYLEVEEELASLNDKELVSFLSAKKTHLGEIDREKIEGYVEGLKERYNREPQDARLQFVEGKVEEFAPARDGIEVQKEEAARKLSEAVEKLFAEGVKEETVEVPITKTAPRVTTEEVNSLGIVERIGKGESYYAHSIPNRVYNVALAASRVSGALVAPGEEFSFNQQVGEISGATGYRTAYVIANGRTELGDGGGVCQVSTTVFRAALLAGLPITERWAHAYRVGYYEQNSKPGFDATIYSPSKDLKFLNDTPGHILVQAIVDEESRHLTIELYGTKDGRVALISPARVWGESPPPPDLYQDDPNLPAGAIKQVDWAAWGAKTAFDYRVERGEETIFAKSFASNYRPWQNVYLRGTGLAE